MGLDAQPPLALSNAARGVALPNAARRVAASSWAHFQAREPGRKLAVLVAVTVLFAVYYMLVHRGDLEATMGDASPLSALLFALNASTGVGGFWQPASRGARAAAVVQFLVLMLLIL